MKATTVIEICDTLRWMGYIANDTEMCRLAGHGAHWMRSLRRRDGQATQSIRTGAAMRIQMRITRWRDTAPPRDAAALTDLLSRMEAA